MAVAADNMARRLARDASRSGDLRGMNTTVMIQGIEGC